MIFEFDESKAGDDLSCTADFQGHGQMPYRWYVFHLPFESIQPNQKYYWLKPAPQSPIYCEDFLCLMHSSVVRIHDCISKYTAYSPGLTVQIELLI